MKQFLFAVVVLLTVNGQWSTVNSQTYVCKNGQTLVEDPDSTTFAGQLLLELMMCS